MLSSRKIQKDRVNIDIDSERYTNYLVKLADLGDEIDRENIKLSVLRPSLVYYEKTKSEMLSLRNYFFPKFLNESITANMIDQSINFKKRIRRF